MNSIREKDIPLYWTDSYQTELSTDIVAIRDTDVQLAQTIFYPSGGGQPFDTGVLQQGEITYEIQEVYQEDTTIWHKIKTNKPLQIDKDSKVLVCINWDTRYALMRTHTAQHIVSYHLKQLYDCSTLKSNIEGYKIDIEIEKELAVNQILEALKLSNIRIEEGASVESLILTQDEYSRDYKDKIRGKKTAESLVRLIKIGDFDIVCCGGTHIKNIQEITGIFLESVKGHNIRLLTNREGINFMNHQRELMIKLEELTIQKGQKMFDMVKNKLDENMFLTDAAVHLLKSYLSNLNPFIKELNGNKVVLLELQGITRQILQMVVNDIQEGIFLVLHGRGNILYFISKTQLLNANEICKKFMERTKTKGGGNTGFAQVLIEGIVNPFSIVEEILKM